MDGWAFSTYCFVAISTFAYVISFIVITIGGVFDFIYLFKSLKMEIVDISDDGRARNIDSGSVCPSEKDAKTIPTAGRSV